MANATRYFDVTPAAAGFGSPMTGAWDTTTANWTASSAGASGTNAAYTFDNTDTAQFGFAGTSGGAGTATISTGVTVTLNQIVTSTLTGLQTIAASGTGTLNLAGTTPTINVGSPGGLSITAPITGTAGFTKSGTGALTATAASSNLIGGTVRVQTGDLRSGNQGATVASNIFPAIDFWQIDAGASRTVWHSGAGYTCKPLLGAGYFYVGNASAATNSATNGIEFDVSNFTGYLVAVCTQNATKAFIRVNSINLTGQTYLDFRNEGGTGSTFTQDFTFPAAASVGVAANPFIVTYSSAVSPTGSPVWNTSITADQTTGSVLIGSITRESSNAVNTTSTLTLQGSSASSNTVSGIIANGTYALAIAKGGSNKWILSGANTFTGGVTLAASGGTLGAYSSGALGATTGAVVINTGSTLEISGGVTLNKVSAALTIGGTGVSNAGAINNISGTNSYTYSGGTLSAATTIQVASGTSLTMTGVLTDGANTYAFTKTGTGELALASANTFTGVMSIVGTLTATTLANGGAASGIGNSTNVAANLLIGTSAAAGTLKHSGADASTDRNWTAGTAGATIDASGSGVLTMTSTTAPSFSAANTATTITVQGTSGNGTTTFNTYSQPISDNAGAAVGFTKTGTGAWKLTNATINNTGALTISDGVLDLNGTARTLTANIVMSGGTLQNSAATVAPATSITMTGGKITANLTGSGKTLTVSSGTPELAPQANDNANLAGTATLSGGILRLTTESSTIGTTGGKVLGTMATTVQNGATIQTTTGTVQRGQMRYGGNLTFQAGATLRIGG